MQPHDERSIEDLLAEADAGRERGTLGATLDAINRSVHDVAVSVTVNLHGKLIGLELTEHAMALPPGELAARISAATTEAAAAALADGMQVLTDSFGGWIGDAIGDQIGVVEQPAAPAPVTKAPGDEDLTPQSWAIAWDA